MTPDRVRPLLESDIDFVIERAGGRRAHLDADRREKIGADYRLGPALIELKVLEDEGLDKPERQAKLARLFRRHAPHKPVIVLDRSVLPREEQALFDRIIEGPIKTGVTKANKQLKQSRVEHVDATCSVLFVLNNGYTTLSHDELKALVERRVKNDTSEIDAVVVAGAYYHSDSFDSIFLWPIDCIQLNANHPFDGFESLKAGWGALSEHFMTAMMRQNLGANLDKGPVVDTRFNVDGVTYVKPSPSIGPTDFFAHGRPRYDSTGLSVCPPVARTFPALSRKQWSLTNKWLGAPAQMMGTYKQWCAEEKFATRTSNPLCPFITMPIILSQLMAWCRAGKHPLSANVLFQFANELFNDEVRKRIDQSEECPPEDRPPCYILVRTEVIGQDRANDISHIALVAELLDSGPSLLSLVNNARIFHEHALALGCAYAVREGVEKVLWSKDTTYAWI